MSEAPLLEVDRLSKHYVLRGGVLRRPVGTVRAVEDVSLTLREGETVGLVGESGCGKSTLGRAVIRLERPTAGRVAIQGREIQALSRRELFPYRRRLAMIFQDPYSSLNPRMTVGESVREPLLVHGAGNRRERLEKAEALFDEVGLAPEMLNRYPHEFSGGQRQRISVARALALEPEFIVADEPVSALDVSVQAQVLNLLVRIQRERRLAYLFISHDLSVVEYISDRVAIMYLGRIVETGSRDDVFNRPAHPYTRALLEAVPNPNPHERQRTAPITGETPSPVNPPAGCAFHPRCPHAVAACREAVPPLESVASNTPEHRAACIRKSEI